MLNFFVRLMNSPQAAFLWAIFTKWYILILIPTLLATYYFFKGLSDAGILDMIQNFTLSKFELAARITKECTAKILNLKELYNCVNYTK